MYNEMEFLHEGFVVVADLLDVNVELGVDVGLDRTGIFF